MSVATAPVLLVVDFPGRRPEGRIADLELEAAGFELCDVLGRPPEAVTATAYAAQMLGDGVDRPDRVVAVLAYCTAASLAQELIVLLGDATPIPPSLVLFDSARCSVEMVAEAYHLSAAQLSMGRPELLTDLVDIGGLIDRPGELVEAVSADLRARGARVLRDDGFTPAEADDLAGQTASTHLSWFTHLVATYGTSAPSWGGEVAHFLSRDTRLSEKWEGASVERRHHFDCDRLGLLRSADVRAAVIDYLGGLTSRPGSGSATD